MNNFKKKAISTKNFVAKHRVSIAVSATSVFWIYVNRKSLAQHNEFLKEKGLYEEFYTPTDEEMGQ